MQPRLGGGIIYPDSTPIVGESNYSHITNISEMDRSKIRAPFESWCEQPEEENLSNWPTCTHDERLC